MEPLKGLNDQELEHRLATLKKYCQEVDPFAPLNSTLQRELKEFGFQWDDPFHLTNLLISHLEEGLNEKERRKKPKVLQ